VIPFSRWVKNQEDKLSVLRLTSSEAIISKISNIKANIRETEETIRDIEIAVKEKNRISLSDQEQRRRKLARKASDMRTIVRKSIEVNKLIKFNMPKLC